MKLDLRKCSMCIFCNKLNKLRYIPFNQIQPLKGTINRKLNLYSCNVRFTTVPLKALFDKE